MNETSRWRLPPNTTFRALWIASIASNIGTWMHDVGAGWMMTGLSSDPLMVALVQAATTLPMFLFVLPSGVLADIVDRRKFLIFAQLWMLLTAAALGILTLFGYVTPVVLLAATFLLGVGAAMAAPPFQSLIPELVGKDELHDAVVLNSLGVNISRAIGPALGGFILSFTGPATVFLLNAFSVLGVVTVVYRWHPAAQSRRLPPEHFLPAVRAGLRYVQAAPMLQVALIHAVAFFSFASAAWALLPLIAKHHLGLSAAGYGGLLGCIGLGAVVGALILPQLRQHLTADSLVAIASSAIATTMLALPHLDNAWVVGGVLMVAGLSWITAISTLNVSAQSSSAGWVKSRALAVYLVAFFGSMAIGSVLWGQVAKVFNTSVALTLAGIGMMVASTVARRWRLASRQPLDLTPMPIPMPMADGLGADAELAEYDRGPVMVSVEYVIHVSDTRDFLDAMREMQRVRRRGGAFSWSVFQDMCDPTRHLEVFMIESWLDHLRQHERFTANDKAIQSRVLGFHRLKKLPEVTHMISH